MKKLFILFTVLTLTNLNAQEKQNDATWEETLNFLEKYKNTIREIRFNSKKGYQVWIDSKNNNYKKHHFNVSFSEKQFVIDCYYFEYPWDHSPSTYRSYEVKLLLSDLKKLKEIKKGAFDKIRLIFLEPVVEIISKTNRRDNKGKYNDTGSYKSRWVELDIINEETRVRYMKALQHLAYLAKQRRLEKQKMSGDKF